MDYKLIHDKENNEFSLVGKDKSGGGFISFGKTPAEAKTNGRYGLEAVCVVDCMNEAVDTYDAIKKAEVKKAYETLSNYEEEKSLEQESC